MAYLVCFGHFFYIDVAKEIENQKEMWHEKGREIESEFKELHQPSRPASKARKGQKNKLLQREGSKELSSYAGSLTKEFLIKVSFLSPILCLFLPFFLSSPPSFPTGRLIKMQMFLFQLRFSFNMQSRI